MADDFDELEAYANSVRGSDAAKPATPKPSYVDDDFSELEKFAENTKKATETPSSPVRRIVGDTATALAKGVVGLPKTIAGMADTAATLLPQNLAATGIRNLAKPAIERVIGKEASDAYEYSMRPGQAGRILETVTNGGLTRAQKGLDTLLSPEQQLANQQVDSAKGVLPTLEAFRKNPSVIAQKVVESVPAMLTGSGIARGIGMIAPKLAAKAGFAIGEGAVSAGQMQESLREQSPTGSTTIGQTALAAGSGALTGVISKYAGKLAGELGIGDIDVFLAGGKANPAVKAGFWKQVIGGMVSEGLLEEAPQSAQEAMAQNLATGKPIMEGVGSSVAQGAVTGGIMGGGFNAVKGGVDAIGGERGGVQPPALPAPVAPITGAIEDATDEQLMAQAQAEASALPPIEPPLLPNEGVAPVEQPAEPSVPVDAPYQPAVGGVVDVNGGIQEPVAPVETPTIESVNAELDRKAKEQAYKDAALFSSIRSLADRMANGDTDFTPEDLQLQANYPKELEKELQINAKVKADIDAKVGPAPAIDQRGKTEKVNDSLSAPLINPSANEGPAGEAIPVKPPTFKSAADLRNAFKADPTIDLSGAPEAMVKQAIAGANKKDAKAIQDAWDARNGAKPSSPPVSSPVEPVKRPAQPVSAPVLENVPPTPRKASTPEMVASERAQDVLDLHKSKTGWKRVVGDNRVTLISFDGKQAVDFVSPDPKSGSAFQRIGAEAQAYAIDNPYTSTTPDGDLVVKPIFKEPEGIKSGVAGEKAVEGGNVPVSDPEKFTPKPFRLSDKEISDLYTEGKSLQLKLFKTDRTPKKVQDPTALKRYNEIKSISAEFNDWKRGQIEAEKQFNDDQLIKRVEKQGLKIGDRYELSGVYSFPLRGRLVASKGMIGLNDGGGFTLIEESQLGKLKSLESASSESIKQPVKVETVTPIADVKGGGEANKDSIKSESTLLEKVISVPSKDKPSITPKEQKAYLLAEIDKAFDEAPIRSSFDNKDITEGGDIGKTLTARGVLLGDWYKQYESIAKSAPKQVTIKVPGDGEYTLSNDKAAIHKFRKVARSGFPTKMPEGNYPAPSRRGDKPYPYEALVTLMVRDPKLIEQYETQVQNEVWPEADNKNVLSAVERAKEKLAQNSGKPIEDLKEFNATQERNRKQARIDAAMAAMQKSPLYRKIQDTLKERGTPLSSDSDVLNVDVSGKGAPAIREMQDKLGYEIGLWPNKKGKRFDLERYYKDIAEGYKSEEGTAEKAIDEQRISEVSANSESVPLSTGTPLGPESMPSVGASSPQESPIKGQPFKRKSVEVETDIEGEPSSIKREMAELEMEQLGFDKPTNFTSQSWDEAKSNAQAILAKDSLAGQTLVNDLTANPRGLKNAEEAALLNITKMQRKAKADTAAREALKASDSRDTARMKAAHEAYKAASESLREVYSLLGKGNDRVGTNTARALKAMGMLLDEQYDVVHMRAQREATLKRPLTADEIRQVNDMSSNLKTTGKLLTDILRRKGRYTDDASAALKEVDDAIKKYENDLKEAKLKEAFQRMILEKMPTVDAVKKRPAALGSILHNEANAARERMKARGSMFSAGVDPQALADAAIIGAEFIYDGAVEFGTWANKMKDAFGEKIQPYLNDIKAASDRFYANRYGKVVSDTAKGKPRKPGTDVLPGYDLVTLRDLFKSQVESGITDPQEALKNVHAIVAETNPAMTVEQVRDAFSEYGKAKLPSSDAVKQTLSDFRRQYQLLASIERVADTLAPLKSGPQRNKPSAAVRELQRRLTKMMKEAGIETVDPETQLATALSAIKSRLSNRIEELDKALKTGERITVDKNVTPYDAEATALKQERDELQTWYDMAFPKAEQTHTQRLNSAIKVAERQSSYWQKRLEDAKRGQFTTEKKEKPPLPNDPRLMLLNNEIEDAKAEIERLKELANPKKSPEQIAVEAAMKRKLAGIKEMERRIREKDFKAKPRQFVDISAYPDAMKANELHEKAKNDYALMKEMDRLSKRPVMQKIFDAILATPYKATRTIKTAYDIGYHGRQGLQILATHPGIWIKTLAPAIRSISQMNSKVYAAKLRGDSDYELANFAGLGLAKDMGDGNFNTVDDVINLRLVNKLPGIQGSVRSYAQAANWMRLTLFKMYLDMDPDPNVRKNTERVRQYARFVNTITGKGKVNSTGFAAQAFFAPSFMMANVESLTGAHLWMYKNDPVVKKRVAQHYAKLLGTLATTYAIHALLSGDDDDWKVDTDMRSGNFGALKFGDKHYWNPLGSASTYLNYASRLISGQTIKTDSSGRKQVVNLRTMGLPFATDEQAREPVPYRQPNLTWQFLEGKLSPAAGIALRLPTGKQYGGYKDMTPASLAKDALAPISYEQSKEFMANEDADAWLVMSVMALLGFDVKPNFNDPEVKRYLDKQ